MNASPGTASTTISPSQSRSIRGRSDNRIHPSTSRASQSRRCAWRLKTASTSGYPESKAMCSYFTCLADSESEVRAAQERLLFYLKNVAPAFPSNPETAPPHIRYFIDIVDRINRMRTEDLGERSIVTGTRDQVIDQLRRVEQAGIEEVICYFNFGLLPHAPTLHQMERFAAEVMPAFTAQPALRA